MMETGNMDTMLFRVFALDADANLANLFSGFDLIVVAQKVLKM